MRVYQFSGIKSRIYSIATNHFRCPGRLKYRSASVLFSTPEARLPSKARLKRSRKPRLSWTGPSQRYRMIGGESQESNLRTFGRNWQIARGASATFSTSANGRTCAMTSREATSSYAVFSLLTDETRGQSVPVGVALWSPQRRWAKGALAGREGATHGLQSQGTRPPGSSHRRQGRALDSDGPIALCRTAGPSL